MKTLLSPDEIFLDSSNLPQFNTQQMEGRLERPISKKVIYFLGLVFGLISLAFIAQASKLELVEGTSFAKRSVNNVLRKIVIFAERGVIYDRNQIELAWNDPGRVYRPTPGLAHLLGYVSYPTEKDLASGEHHPQNLIGRDGVEKAYDNNLRGKNGLKIEEVDVQGQIESDYLYETPQNGADLVLSLDSRIQEKLFEFIQETAIDRGFFAGTGVILDIETGEIIALTNFPEYNSTTLSEAKDKEKIQAFLTDKHKPFLNRAVNGLYTPGSTVKPILAVGALTEKIISPDKKILSTGELVIPNPYDPDRPSVFKDWKAHGWVDLKEALAKSSNVYFYEVGGGFEDQPGLGIGKIEKYARLFGLGAPTGFVLERGETGTIPNPTWKAKHFNGEIWRLGDTYHSSIGQYGWQVTPLQMVRVAGAMGSGNLVTPTILFNNQDKANKQHLPISEATLQTVREGMRLAVTNGGVTGLNLDKIHVAAKTGTAELGSTKEEITSWVTGFFPYEKPKYAFTVTMERGPRDNNIGGVYVMRQLFDWMLINTPEYFSEIDQYIEIK